jgi:putative DNA primase/helicase
MSTISNVLDRLQRVRPLGDGKHQALCPAHEDSNASLSVSVGDNGAVLLHCHAGCKTKDICRKINLELKDLFPPRANGNGQAVRRPVKAHDYRDAEGQLVYQSVRYEPKDFNQRKPDGNGGWIWDLKGVQRVLYRLPELLNSAEMRPDEWVFAVEGEKDADRLNDAGLIATCNVGGAGKWRDEYSDALAGRRVALIPDNDRPGHDHVEKAARSLAGKAAEIRVVELPGVPPKGDVSDYLGAGNTVDDLLKLVAAAPVWTANQVERALSMMPEPTPTPTDQPCHGPIDFVLTDAGNSERLMDRHGARLKFVPRWKKAIVYVGTHWEIDESGEPDRLALETVRDMKRQAAKLAESEDDSLHALGLKMLKHAHNSESHKRLRDMVTRAASVSGASVVPDDLDSDRWSFNCKNGTLDLRKFQLRPHQPADLITKLCPVDYDPSLTCPTFLAFLDRIFEGKGQLIAFVQRMIGYTLTGDTSERALFVFYGLGANGKSTLLSVLRELLANYSMQISADSLMVKKNGGIPNDLARLKAARAVTAIESEEDQQIAEGLVKTLTGGEDVVTARFLFGEFFEYRPTFKCFLATNHRPEIRGTDDAIWDRIKLIPFNVRFYDDPEEAQEECGDPKRVKDKQLIDKLKGELAGILAWAVEGCREWQRVGLGAPQEVRQAVEAYRDDMDRLGDFLADACEVSAEYEAAATPLHKVYEAWCQLNGEKAMNQTKFGRKLEGRGFASGREKTGACRKTRKGLRIKASEPSESPYG